MSCHASLLKGNSTPVLTRAYTADVAGYCSLTTAVTVLTEATSSLVSTTERSELNAAT